MPVLVAFWPVTEAGPDARPCSSAAYEAHGCAQRVAEEAVAALPVSGSTRGGPTELRLLKHLKHENVSVGGRGERGGGRARGAAQL